MDVGSFVFLAMGVVPLLVSLLVLALSLYFRSVGLAFTALAILVFPIFYWSFVAALYGM